MEMTQLILMTTDRVGGIIYNAIALIAFMAFFPILLLVILIQNNLSRGLTMGAVKG